MQPAMNVSERSQAMEDVACAISLSSRCRTRRKNQSIDSKSVRCIRSHPAVQIHVIPPRDLRHLCPICCFS
jgi:hypothetical protein